MQTTLNRRETFIREVLILTVALRKIMVFQQRKNDNEHSGNTVAMVCQVVKRRKQQPVIIIMVFKATRLAQLDKRRSTEREADAQGL